MSVTVMTKNKGAQTLAKLVRVLSKAKFQTVAEISAQTKLSRVVLYKRLGDLEACGCKLETADAKREEGQKGPTPRGFRLVENRASKKLLTGSAS